MRAARERLVAVLELRRVELELREHGVQVKAKRSARAKQHETVDAQLGHLTLDPSGRIVEIDAGAAAVLGVFRERGAGAPLARAFRAEEAAALRAHLARCAVRRTSSSHDATIFRTGRPPRFVQLATTPLFDRAQRIRGFRVVLADVTAQRTLKTRLRFLAAAGEALASTLDYKDTLRALARIAVPTLADLCVVDLCEDDGRLRRLEAFFAHGTVPAHVAKRVKEWSPQRDSPQAQVLASGQVLLKAKRPRRKATPKIGDPLDRLPLRSLVCVPLRARGRAHGVLTLATLEGARSISSSDVVFLVDVARRASMAIDNAALYELAQKTLIAERQARHEAESLRLEALDFYALADAMNQAYTVSAASRTVLEAIERLLGWKRAAVVCSASASPEESAARRGTWRGLCDPLRRAIEAHAWWKETASRVSPLAVPNVLEDPAWSQLHAQLRAESVHAVVVVPVAYGKQLVARIALFGEATPTAAQIDCVKRIGRHFAHAMRRIDSETATRRARREAEQAKALLDTLFSNAPVGLAYWDSSMRCIRANPKMTAMTRLEGGTPMHTWAKDDIGDKVIANVLRVLGTHRPIVEDETSGAVPGDGVRHLRASYYPVPGATPGSRGVGAVFVDNTHRRRREIRLRAIAEASRLFATPLDTHEDALLALLAQLCTASFASACFVDLVCEDGVVRHAAARASNHALDAIVETLSTSSIERGAAHLSRGALDSGKGILVEDAAKSAPEGVHAEALLLRSTRPASLIMTPLVVRGMVIGAIVFLSAPDVPFDEEDLRFAEELAGRAAFAVHNMRLHRQARQAVEARENLLAVVSHDLRNPLSAIVLSTDALLKSVPNDRRTESRRRALAIKRASERMCDLIGGLLDMASIEAGQLVIERRPVAVAPFIDEVIEAHEPMAARQALCLVRKVEAVELELLCDRRRIYQVLANLLGNAFKFTPPGGAVTVRVRPVGGEALVEVSDTGPGIAPDERVHVFERFWRAKDSAGLGAGLGLSISKGIVEAHGGRIWVESEVGMGATFFFTVPLAVRHEETSSVRPA